VGSSPRHLRPTPAHGWAVNNNNKTKNNNVFQRLPTHFPLRFLTLTLTLLTNCLLRHTEAPRPLQAPPLLSLALKSKAGRGCKLEHERKQNFGQLENCAGVGLQAKMWGAGNKRAQHTGLPTMPSLAPKEPPPPRHHSPQGNSGDLEGQLAELNKETNRDRKLTPPIELATSARRC